MPALPRLSSTILLIRDAPDLQVLMVKRNYQIDFASGALVFPGGKTKANDEQDSWRDYCDGDYLATDQATRISAIRKTFEETGILLARHARARGEGQPLIRADEAAKYWYLREKIDKGEVDFLTMIRDNNLVLALEQLIPFAHWITPVFMPNRFDTHFYLAVAPEDQLSEHDGREVIDIEWVTPAGALAQNESKAVKILFPTRVNLELLGKSVDVATALTHTKTRKIITVTPEMVKENGVSFLKIPTEAGYSVDREEITSRSV